MRQVSPNLVRVVVLTVAVLWGAYLLRLVLLPFVGAGALAVLAEPAMRWMCGSLHWPRWVAATVAFLVILLIVAAVAYGVAAFAIPEFETVSGQIPQEVEVLLKRLFGGEALHLFGWRLSPEQVAVDLQTGVQQLFTGQSVARIAGVGIGVVMGVVMGVVLTFYFLLQGPQLVNGMVWMAPPEYRPAARRFLERALPVLMRYIGGVLVVVSYASVLTWLVARWILGVPHAALFAVAVGILELIPVVGPIASALLIGAVALSRGGVGEILGFAGFALGLRLSIDQVFGPVILGRAVSLPAPVILFAMICGGAVWGILGVLLAVPFAAMVRVALEQAYEVEEGGSGHE